MLYSQRIDRLISIEPTLQTIASKNCFSSLVLVDLNAKNKVWFDQDELTTEENVINDLMAQHGLAQIIDEPTHLHDCSYSCVDLVFTSPDNLVTNSGVHSSLHSNCHHQIIFSKFNLNISYPPPYERVVSENNKANYDLITKTIDAFD